MKNIVIYTLGLFLSLGLISCSQKEEAKRVPLAPKKVKADTILLEDVALPVYSSFSGVVEPKVRVNLSAKIPAYVKVVGVEEGDFVEKGDLLVRLDDTEIRSKINGLVEQKKALQKDKAALESDYSYAKALRSF
ncbi:hypothetical protein DBT_0240 [Dissulfuribacter thermophilus]|uniref:Uncharacterized protein n=1 Tax=Dissulfuribacter thermophilus TaxID=1156395 RepID=A0A1B9F940_9BACT|nr:biotin/lipoyl-binding protein [Dissulfuribacter thermophilus]OCC16423.1 hypothetical protein DBT_0240 [Dissulfuribacter thermophilus]